jgi:hypothetical protein
MRAPNIGISEVHAMMAWRCNESDDWYGLLAWIYVSQTWFSSLSDCCILVIRHHVRRLRHQAKRYKRVSIDGLLDERST